MSRDEFSRKQWDVIDSELGRLTDELYNLCVKVKDAYEFDNVVHKLLKDALRKTTQAFIESSKHSNL